MRHPMRRVPWAEAPAGLLAKRPVFQTRQHLRFTLELVAEEFLVFAEEGLFERDLEK